MVDSETTEEATEEPASGELKGVPKGRQSFSKVRRELSDEELSSPAVQRMLIDEIERLERDNTRLGGFQDRFHGADRRVGILEEKLQQSHSGEIIFGVCLTVGAAAMGYAPAAWSNQPDGWLSLAFGVLLVAGGIASRVVHR